MRGKGLLLFLVAAAACHADDPPAQTDGGGGDACGPGLVAVDEACAPVLDECATDEVPLLGGGCKRVGVRECPGGIAGPPDWTCKRIGVEECTPAAGGWGLKGPPGWTCQAVGPPGKCLAGWSRVKGGWCEPLLPKGKCPDGTLAVLGTSTCQPIDDCGTGKWGNIKPTPKTVFVDASYSGGSSDGTQAKPYTTITAPLKAVPSPHIAVAAGTYEEELSILDSWTLLEGRCAKLVKIEGQTGTSPAVIIGPSNVTLRGVTVTGAGTGVWVTSGKSVVLDRIVIRGVDTALRITDAVVTATDSLLTDNVGAGIFVEQGGDATVERSVIRDTKPRPPGQFGWGVHVQGAKLTLRDGLVQGNTEIGVSIASGDVQLARSVIRGTRPTSSLQLSGFGVLVNAGTSNKRSKLVVRDAVIASNANGVGLASSAGLIERTVIRDSRAGDPSYKGGAGVYLDTQKGGGYAPAELTLRDSLVTGSTATATGIAGVLLIGGKSRIERSVIQRNGQLAGVTSSGAGLLAGIDPVTSTMAEIKVSQTVVAQNTGVGIRLMSAKLELERSVLRDHIPDPKQMKGGFGLEATVYPLDTRRSSVAISDCLVERNEDVGLRLAAGEGTIARTVVRHQRPNRYSADVGYGLFVGADPTEDARSTLTAKECLIHDNWKAGIVVNNSIATFERCVVRANRELPRLDRPTGFGIAVARDVGRNGTPRVELDDCLLAGNRAAGAGLETGTLVLRRSVVRDTRPSSAGKGGHGVKVINVTPGWTPPILQLTETVVTGNTTVGLNLYSGEAKLERSVVRGTATKQPEGTHGIGVVVGYYPTPSRPPKLSLLESQILDNHSVGVSVLGQAEATVARSQVRGTRAVKRRYGDGLMVTWGAKLRLWDSLVGTSARAGLLVDSSGGYARRSVFEAGQIPISVSGGSFLVADDNAYLRNQTNRVITGQKVPTAPAPDVPEPFAGK